jgi:GNAT superfamily N-acetyltransferase
METRHVTPIGRDGVARVVDVLSEAFADYPVMRFVLGPERPDYDRDLRTLVGFFVMARALRDEPLLGIEMEGALGAAAIVSFPGRSESPAELDRLREEVWADLGEEARARYATCTAAWEPLSVEVPHIHLNMIGVGRSHQGGGLGSRLLDHVQELSRGRGDSQGVTLTTETPSNVRWYERHGYEITGHAWITTKLETWAFYRRN